MISISVPLLLKCLQITDWNIPDIAINIGKANGLDLAELEAGREDNGARSKHSKLWQTATFFRR